MTIDRIREQLDRGAPWEACDAFRAAAGATSGDAALLYWGALAHARAGATHDAHPLLDRAQAAAETAARAAIGTAAETANARVLLVEILSLRGRLFKDAAHRAVRRSREDAARAMVLARDQYLAAHRLNRDPYPAVNAATLSLLLGDAAQARGLATEAIVASDNAPKGSTLPVWTHATIGEARLLLGDPDGARRSYIEAKHAAAGNAGIVASMRRQLALLASVLPAADGVLEVLPASSVLAFSGHMIDAAGRARPRFPAALVPQVSEALRAYLAGLHAPVVFASAACGADLLFGEAALDVGAEVNIVLPFNRDEFVRTSVDPGGSEWVPRFDSVLARAQRVIVASSEQHLGDDVLFDHAARMVEGLARLRAEQLQAVPALLCVCDPDDDGSARVGGAQATLERWRARGGAAEIIDLRRLRGGTDDESARAADAATAAVPPLPRGDRSRRRTLKTMMFADFAGYSKLHDAVIPVFQREFLEVAASLIESSGARPLEAKTWGDALYTVFDDADDAAEFALSFAGRMRSVDWSGAGVSGAGQVRVALHAGPVFHCFDPVMRSDSYFGANVTRAARIEPITPPGVVYSSEAFAATLAADGEGGYALEYVGSLPLAKGYGDERVYRLERA